MIFSPIQLINGQQPKKPQPQNPLPNVSQVLASLYAAQVRQALLNLATLQSQQLLNTRKDLAQPLQVQIPPKSMEPVNQLAFTPVKRTADLEFQLASASTQFSLSENKNDASKDSSPSSFCEDQLMFDQSESANQY